MGTLLSSCNFNIAAMSSGFWDAAAAFDSSRGMAYFLTTFLVVLEADETLSVTVGSRSA